MLNQLSSSCLFGFRSNNAPSSIILAFGKVVEWGITLFSLVRPLAMTSQHWRSVSQMQFFHNWSPPNKRLNCCNHWLCFSLLLSFTLEQISVDSVEDRESLKRNIPLSSRFFWNKGIKLCEGNAVSYRMMKMSCCTVDVACFKLIKSKIFLITFQVTKFQIN